ncbi:MAG: hypothetical protein ABIR56_00255, partial [Polaromonas sp.]
MTKKPDLPQAHDKGPMDTPKPHPNPASRSPRSGEDFGLEGTNKTVPVPQPNAEPADELQGTKA